MKQKIKDIFRFLKEKWLSFRTKSHKILAIIVKYLLKHPFKFLITLIAFGILAVAIYLAHDYLFGNTVWKKTVQPEIAQTVSVPKTKKFAKDIKLKHTDVRQENTSTENNTANADFIDEPKYLIWRLKHRPHTLKLQDTENEEQKVITEKTGQQEVAQQAESALQEPAESDTLLKETNKEDAPKVQKEEEVIEVEVARETPQPDTLDDAVSEKANITYQKLDNQQGFRYLDVPESIKGSAMVYGPNTLYIDDSYISLYGIKTNPIKYEQDKVTAFLRDFIAEEIVLCYIVAYDASDMPMAICFAKDKNLNQMLVEEKMADNIAL